MKFQRLTGRMVLLHTAELVEIYRAAFAGPPWNEDGHGAAEFAKRLTTDALRPGFVAALATQDGKPAGFGTAWPTRHPFPGGRAYDRVRLELGDRVEADLVGALEIDELAVAPHARGQGVARRILDLLCANASRCWLLTAPQAHDAIRFYERQGWQRLTNPDATVVVFNRLTVE